MANEKIEQKKKIMKIISESDATLLAYAQK